MIKRVSVQRILVLFLTIVYIQSYFCVNTPVANPANTFITNFPCTGAYQVLISSEMSAKMLAYHITVDYSLLVNVPPTDYNNLINKPTILNGVNGKDGKDCNEAILWVLIAWCVILTLIIILLIVYIFKSKTTIHS